jgi:Ca2+-binding RTX toxin-like protein
MRRLSVLVATTCLLLLNVPAAQAAMTCFGKTPTITGTSGDDIIHGTPQADVIWAGGGFDYVTGGEGADLICGGNKGDSLYGGRGNDKIAGQGGIDQLLGGSGSDVMRGGGQVQSNFAGGDIVAYDASTGVVVNLRTGRGGPIGQDQDTLSGFSGIQGTNFDDILIAAANGHGNALFGAGGDDTLVGNDALTQGDALLGGEGDDQVYAGDGPDVVSGYLGDDVLRGGGDSSGAGDTVSYEFDTGPVQVNLATLSGTGEGADTLFGFRNVIGTPFSDSLTGDAAPNSIEGRGGDDTLNVSDGIGGNDTADGGTGTDTCAYDPGDTVLNCP